MFASEDELGIGECDEARLIFAYCVEARDDVSGHGSRHR